MPTVYIKETEEGFVMMRNGEPFYIKGAAGNGKFLEELKEAGGNTIRVYDTLGLENILDEAESLGLAVVVDIPLPSYRDHPSHYEQDLEYEKKKVINFVKQIKDHPALLYWNLGNELKYPFFYERTDFFQNYNDLIEGIKEIDSNHPVSTSIAGSNKRRLNSIFFRSSGLDFISLNIFGGLSSLEENLQAWDLFWKGPYVISEWGINGPWEESQIGWTSPIEPVSNVKPKILEERYRSKALNNGRCLGNIVFYWGTRQESTPTWFSIFSEKGEKSPSFYKLKELWSGEEVLYEGPQIKYALLNDRGAPEGIILPASTKAQMSIHFENFKENNFRFNYTIRPEAWADRYKETDTLSGLFLEQSLSHSTFNTPEKEGPYRIYFKAWDTLNRFSTVNIPFYVLNPKDE